MTPFLLDSSRFSEDTRPPTRPPAGELPIHLMLALRRVNFLRPTISRMSSTTIFDKCAGPANCKACNSSILSSGLGCRILDKSIPSKPVYEDDVVYCFRDIS